jgi:hypothetical protein
MKGCRAHALALFDVAERTTRPEFKARTVAVAEAWLIFAAMEEPLAFWADEVKRKMPSPVPITGGA